jgi:hypothetical protein
MKNHKSERDEFILAYHTAKDPSGLKCPLCGAWSPLQIDSPQGVKLACTHCGTVAVMPRVQLARAIQRYR